MKAKKLSKMRILNKPRDDTMHRSISFEPNELRCYLHHTRPLQKGYMCQLQVSFFENSFGVFQKAPVATQILRCFAGDLPLDIGQIGRVIEAETILPK